MPDPTMTVGGLTLPLPAGTVGQHLDDPLLLGLGDFLSFMLRQNLNAKLTNVPGTSSDACPTGNVFPYDPATYHVRNPTPSLYVWWKGPSKRNQMTLLYDYRERTAGLAYFFDEIVAPASMPHLNGLLAAVDATFFEAADEGADPAYSYNGDPLGTPLYQSLGIRGWRYEGGIGSLAVPVPDVGGLDTGDGYTQRGLPCLLGSVTVFEKIGRRFAPITTGSPGPGSDFNDTASIDVYEGTDILVRSGKPIGS